MIFGCSVLNFGRYFKFLFTAKRMMKLMKVKLFLVAACVVGLGAYGCSSDDGGNNNNGGGAKANESTFTVNVSGSAGSGKLEGTQRDEQAGENTWGATIAGDTLMLFLMDADGTTLTATVKTSEDLRAPGTFEVGDEFADQTVTLLNPLAGNVFHSVGEGTIKLDNCPRVMGDHIRGSFQNVTLRGEIGDATQTLNGSFDLVVYAKSGDLFCKEAQTGNNGGNETDVGQGGQDTDNTPAVCLADLCEDGGVCCPFIECVSSCETKCVMETCMMNPGSAECFSCMAGCPDSCNVSQECRTALVQLDTCGENHGCSEAADDDEELECLKESCCNELQAAY